MNIGTRELRCLIALDEERSFTDAAILLGVSQAAVSRILARLEADLGTKLVARTTREVRLTDAGERFLAHARRALAEITAGVQAAVDPGAAEFRLGYAWSALGSFTLPLFRKWDDGGAARPPLRLVRRNSPDAGLLDGRSDVAVVRRIPEPSEAYEWAEVGHEQRVCVCSADSEWGRRESVTLAEISTAPLAVNPRTGTTSDALWPDGRPNSHTVTTDDVDEWLDLIVSGAAVGVTSIATAHHYPRSGIRYVPVSDAETLPVYLLWLAGAAHPSTTELVATVRELYRVSSGGSPG
jgi:DNA-binding transcriptional LysR family regulator